VGARGLTLAYRTQPGRCTKLNQGFATRIKASPPGGPSAGTVRPFRHDFENAQNDFDLGIGHLIPENPRSPSVFRDGRRFRYPRSGRSEAADDQAGVRSHLPRRRINAYRSGTAPSEYTAIGATTSLGCLTIRRGHEPVLGGSEGGGGALDRCRYATRPTECRHLDQEAEATAHNTSSTDPITARRLPRDSTNACRSRLIVGLPPL
jgi:hypothetical protein